ncbi:MAG: sulfate adenylyltransferase [Acidobacteria bacterium]|nr:sulfate adenylyltransferase [Acidobacteriota bacterium]
MNLIEAHGGRLIDREARGAERESLLRASKNMPSLNLNRRTISDLELIANGALSPLEGFMGEADYLSVRDNRRLSDGLVWTIPVTLPVSADDREQINPGDDVALRNADGRLLAVLHLSEIFKYDKQAEAESVYRTTDDNHPGVKALYSQGDYLLGGKISLLESVNRGEFAPYRFSPRDLRALFADRRWERVVAFQTRNPVHRAHEYIQKCALETVDGLLLHPLVGETKDGDIPATVRIRAYEVIINHYYPLARTQLAVLPAAMRYAGPREAVFHAIIRQNYGCSHFIVGRDHAGVGNYYGTYDAQRVFGDFKPGELKITPMFFDNTFFCRKCDGMASLKTCPHDQEEHINLSGTKVREMLSRGEVPPAEFTRQEVAQVLIDALKVEEVERNVLTTTLVAGIAAKISDRRLMKKG